MVKLWPSIITGAQILFIYFDLIVNSDNFAPFLFPLLTNKHLNKTIHYQKKVFKLISNFGTNPQTIIYSQHHTSLWILQTETLQWIGEYNVPMI